jgi:uncharacterized Rmd1/YagE family protein
MSLISDPGRSATPGAAHARRADEDAEFAPLSARAILLGERIDTAGLERRDAISSTPLAFRVDGGLCVVFRYGVVVFLGVSPSAQTAVLTSIAPRVVRPSAVQEEETIHLAPLDGADERAESDGVVRISDISPARLLVVADALAKSASLAHDERQVSSVFETIEPWARELSDRGRRPGGRRAMIRLIGAGLLVQHRVAGRVAVSEKPELLWDRPDLERLYARLEDEYELVERAEILNRKLTLIGETARLMTELIDTERSLRLEWIVVLLIGLEIALTLFQIARGWTP